MGLAASTNVGASDAVGEGHGTFELFNANGAAAYPNYRKVYADLLVKYRHASLLVEFGNATAAELDELYVAPSTNQFLVPTQISEYLFLGTGLNAQLSYSLSSKWSLQGRYTQIDPEFGGNPRSLVRPAQTFTLGGTRYIAGSAAKLQLQISAVSMAEETSMNAAVALQFGF